MTSPTVIEKLPVDIDLSGGIDESSPEESIDWTKKFVSLKNVVLNGDGMSTRPGLRVVGTATAGSRLGFMAAGLVSAGTISGQSSNAFTQVDEGHTTYAMSAKGSMPAFVVKESRAASSAPAGAGQFAGVFGVANITGYQAIAHAGPISPVVGVTMYLTVVDTTSKNVVRSYRINENALILLQLQMVAVDDRYFHIYLTDGSLKPRVTVLDSTSMTSNEDFYAAQSWTNLTGTSNGDRLAGVVAITNASVAVTRGATCRIEKFNNSGATVSNNTVATISCTGLTTDGTSFMLSGNTGGTYVYKEVSAAYATTRTVTGPTFPAGGVGEIRVCYSGEGNALAGALTGDAYMVAYVKETDQNSFDYPCPVVYSLATGASSFTTVGYLPNWMEASCPIYLNGIPVVHMHNVVHGSFVTPGTGGGVVSATCTDDYVANCSAIINLTGFSSTLADRYPRTFRVEAILDTYASGSGYPNSSLTYNPAGSVFNDTTGPLNPLGAPYRPSFVQTSGVLTSGNGALFAHWDKLSATVESGLSFKLDTVVQAGPSIDDIKMSDDCISGGVCSLYDGQQVQEFGFVSAPSMSAKYDNTGGSIPAGTYYYVCVFSYTDKQGNTHYSRCSRPAAVVLSGTGRVTVQVIVPTVTNRTVKTHLNVYRTDLVGTQYYQVAQYPITTAVGTSTVPDNEVYYQFTDSILSAQLLSNPLLYRQPGTVGTALDRYHAIGGSFILRHKDRVFYCKNSDVYYSSFAVSGEAPWFSPAFSFNVPGGYGDIVGMVSMDGQLVIFKRDAIFVVEGDGPSENGGNGTEYSPPRRIATEFGAIDSRYLVLTPGGIMYRSERGIELLTRSLQVVNPMFGMRVQRTTDLWPVGPHTTNGVKSGNIYGGAAFDRGSGRVYFVAKAIDSTNSTLVYDITNDAWTSNVYTGTIYDVCFARSVNNGGIKGDRLYFTDGTSLLCEDQDTSLDKYTSGGSDVHIPWTIETGWIKSVGTRDKPASKQDRIRVSDFVMAGHWQSNHNVKVVNYVNYVTATPTTIATFTADLTNLTPEQLEFHPAKELVQSMKFKLTTETPTVSTALTTGKQMDLFALSVKMGLKGNGAKIATAQKG